MKYYFLLFLMSIVFYNFADAQFTIESYPIDSFKLPDIDRRTLELAGNLFGDFNSKSNSELNRSYTVSEFNPVVNFFYTHYINRSDLQAFYSASVSPDFSFNSSSDKYSDEFTRSHSFQPSIHSSSDRLNYKGNHFTSLGLNTDITFDQRFSRYAALGFEDQSRAHGLDFSLEVPIGIGTGRLEQVSDMAMALFLINDAIDAGVDVSLVTPEQVNAFAERMVTLRNERVFDSRIKRIHELRELYNFMKENNWTMADDPGFFTVLTDNWLYNVNVSRLSGKRWTYKFIPSFLFDTEKFWLNDTITFRSDFSRLGGGVRVDFEKYKPVNVHHDIFRTHSFNYQFTHDVSSNDFSNRHEDAMQVSFSTSLGHQWIPNSRTLVRTSIGINYLYDLAFPSETQSSEDNHRVQLSLNGTANYFISYRTRFFCDFTMSYNYNKNGTAFVIPSAPGETQRYDNNIHIRLNGGITVSLF